MAQEFTTKKGVKVKIVNSEKDGLSLSWGITYPGLCSDYGETVGTNHQFRNKQVEKKYRRIPDEQVVNDLFKMIKTKRWLRKLDFSDISSIVYKHLKELYGDEGLRYYYTTYID